LRGFPRRGVDLPPVAPEPFRRRNWCLVVGRNSVRDLSDVSRPGSQHHAAEEKPVAGELIRAMIGRIMGQCGA